MPLVLYWRRTIRERWRRLHIGMTDAELDDMERYVRGRHWGKKSMFLRGPAPVFGRIPDMLPAKLALYPKERPELPEVSR